MIRCRFGVAVKTTLVSALIFLMISGRVPAGPRARKSALVPPDGPAADQWAKISALILSGLEQRNIPSVSIAVARKGTVIWERSFGWANRDNKISASPETVYSMASVTKPMTATALMILASRGLVDLDAPVERYIGPGLLTIYEGSARDATIRRLLHHTSGLPQHFNYFYADEPDQPLPLQDTIRRFGIIVTPPGRDFVYANLGFAIIGDIVARVSGRPLAEFMRDEVYRPLGMTSAVFDPDIHRPGNLAAEYDNQGGLVPFHTCDTPGAGNGYASARDLIRFGMFHLKDHLKDQKLILDDAAIDRMQTERDGAVHPGGGGNESYGLGWFFKQTAAGVRTIWHEGGWTGASVMLKLVPSEDLAVAVLMNVYDSEFVNRLADETIRAVLPDFEISGNTTAGRVQPPPPFELPTGAFAGEVRVSGRAISLILEKDGSGKITARFGGPESPPVPVFILPPAVLRAPGQFLGAFPGPVGDQAAARHPHRVFLDLKSVEGGFVGTASAMTMGGHNFSGVSDQRMHFHLPYRVSLKRTGSG
jgi:CubicO group peptidase (beta-lactamase class C family)